LVLVGVICALMAGNAAGSVAAGVPAAAPDSALDGALDGAPDDPGQALYDGHCGECHGAEGRGGKGPRLVPLAWTYEQLLRQIRHPECDMDPIPEAQLSDAEVAKIVTYLKAVK
jgi:mono/diheme cytochrome c family protein